MSADPLYFIIGSNSFSGASYAASLVKRGLSVIGSSRSAEPHEAFLPYRWSDKRDLFEFHQLDLNTDLDRMSELLEARRPTHIVNFAAQSMVAESWINPDHWFMTNVVSTVRLHERLRKMDFLKAYVHVTTPEVYGSTSGSVTEDARFNPSTPYAVSRAAGDMSLQTYFKNYGFPVLFTRAANVYGPGQQLYRIIPRTILSIRCGRKLQLHGGGASERSFIHMADVSDATSRIAERGRAGETYHISTERIVTVRELVELICKRMGANFADHVEVVGERPGKDAAYKLDAGKLRRELGWNDTVSLEAGLDETIAWVDRFLPDLKSMSWDYIHKP